MQEEGPSTSFMTIQAKHSCLLKGLLVASLFLGRVFAYGAEAATIVTEGSAVTQVGPVIAGRTDVPVGWCTGSEIRNPSRDIIIQQTDFTLTIINEKEGGAFYLDGPSRDMALVIDRNGDATRRVGAGEMPYLRRTGSTEIILTVKEQGLENGTLSPVGTGAISALQGFAVLAMAAVGLLVTKT